MEPSSVTECENPDEDVKKRRRGRRGGKGRKNKVDSLQDEVADFLHLENLYITSVEKEIQVKYEHKANEAKQCFVSQVTNNSGKKKCRRDLYKEKKREKLLQDDLLKSSNHISFCSDSGEDEVINKVTNKMRICCEEKRNYLRMSKKTENFTCNRVKKKFEPREEFTCRCKKKYLKEKKMKKNEQESGKTENSMHSKWSKSELMSEKQKSNKYNEDSKFPKHMRKRDALRLLEPENPFFIKGYIRVNPHNYTQAFVSTENRHDVQISGARNRNRAMDKDLVIVKINPEEEWLQFENGEIQRTGVVICILEKKHPRKAVGTLSMDKNNFKLKSRNKTDPCVYINAKSVPEEFLSSSKSFSKTLFLASMEMWLNPYCCRGSIESIVGHVGDLESETSGILLAKGLEVTPYDDELMKELPSDDYLLVDSDLDGREDWRDECVFTIDPATAVDLDDAVSCKKLPNGNYEVGVHISDVTHYLKAFSPLDEEVSKRATTVYLVNTAYHMLPKPLCKLCSLLPGQEKLSFSVIWEMTPEAKVIKHRFAKTIIKSCYQMSYEVAQQMIDQSSREWTKDDLPNLEGNHSPNEIREIVNNLYKLSTQMREKRFADGALSLNQPKLQMILDKETGFPISFRIEERQDSNRLIEEFMLLANMTVAEHLYENMSDSAFLRIHAEPLPRILSQTAQDLSHLGVHLDVRSAAGLQSSLMFYEKSGLEGYYNEFATNCRMMVITALCAQSMPRAAYTCSGTILEKEQLRHYALNVPFYTHFTSPIRRYADCVVHRLLFASMKDSPMPDQWSADLCAKIAANCNAKKYNAKLAQEESNELYFVDFLSRNGPTETVAIVMKVKKRSMDVILCHVGVTVTVDYTDLQKEAEVEYNKDDSVSTLIVKWKKSETSQTINVFSIINLRIEKHPKKYSIRSTLLPTRLIDV